MAAEAHLKFAMQDVAARFQKETEKTVKPFYDSSGNFFVVLLDELQNVEAFCADKRLRGESQRTASNWFSIAIDKCILTQSSTTRARQAATWDTLRLRNHSATRSR